MPDECARLLAEVRANLMTASEKIDRIVDQHAKNAVTRHKNLAEFAFRTSGGEEMAKRVRDMLWAHSIEDGNIQNLLEEVAVDVHSEWSALGKLKEELSEVGDAWKATIDEVVSAKVNAETRVAELTERLKEHALHNADVRETVWAMTSGKCFYCEVDLIRCVGGEQDRSRCFHIDHIVPKVSGGPDHISNYVPACERCNISKNAKSFVEFLAWRKAQQAPLQLTVIEGGAVA